MQGNWVADFDGNTVKPRRWIGVSENKSVKPSNPTPISNAPADSKCSSVGKFKMIRCDQETIIRAEMYPSEMHMRGITVKIFCIVKHDNEFQVNCIALVISRSWPTMNYFNENSTLHIGNALGFINLSNHLQRHHSSWVQLAIAQQAHSHVFKWEDYYLSTTPHSFTLPEQQSNSSRPSEFDLQGDAWSAQCTSFNVCIIIILLSLPPFFCFLTRQYISSLWKFCCWVCWVIKVHYIIRINTDCWELCNWDCLLLIQFFLILYLAVNYLQCYLCSKRIITTVRTPPSIHLPGIALQPCKAKSENLHHSANDSLVPIPRKLVKSELGEWQVHKWCQ